MSLLPRRFCIEWDYSWGDYGVFFEGHKTGLGAKRIADIEDGKYWGPLSTDSSRGIMRVLNNLVKRGRIRRIEGSGKDQAHEKEVGGIYVCKYELVPNEDDEIAKHFAADVLNRVRVYGSSLEYELMRTERAFEEGTPAEFIEKIKTWARSMKEQA